MIKVLSKWSPEKWLFWIVAISLLLRIGAAVYMGDKVVDLPGAYDQISYDALAHRLLAGHGFSFGQFWWPYTSANTPTAQWSFLYVLYLAGVYLIFGFHPLVARLIQAIVAGSLMPWLVYRLGKRSFGATVGLAAAAIMAVYIYFIYYNAALMTETFFTLGALWAFDLAEQIKASAGQRWRDWLFLGVAMGITILIRQTYFPIVVLIGAWLVYVTPGQRTKTLLRFALSVGVVALLILPWTIRNYAAYGQFVLLNTNAGFAFFFDNNPAQGTNAALLNSATYFQLIPPALRGLNEAALDSALMRLSIQFVLKDPGRYLLLSLNRFKDQFWFWPSPQSGFISNISRVGSFGLFFPFMLYGAYLNIKTIKQVRLSAWLATPAALWLVFFVVYNLEYLLSWGSVRYRLPTDAVMIIFAGLALVTLARRILAARKPGVQVASA